jgi:hypothetical protein
MSFLSSSGRHRHDDEWVLKVRQVLACHKDAGTLLLSKPGCVEWCFPGSSFVKSLTKESEKEWGTEVLGRDTKQWTTTLAETLLKEVLVLTGKNPQRGSFSMKNGKRLRPDWETEDSVFECKARTYTIPGTAGEKIFAVPIKYGEIPREYKISLVIVLVAYQEEEAVGSFSLFENEVGTHLSRQKMLWEENHTRYVRFTDMLKQLCEK